MLLHPLEGARPDTLQRGNIPKPLGGMKYAKFCHPLHGTEFWAPEGAVPSVKLQSWGGREASGG